MGPFMFAAMSLIVLTLLMLLRPWQRHAADHTTTAREINAGICADQLAELDRDLAAGTLAAADHAQARDELRRRLLADTAGGEAPLGVAARSRNATLALALAVPLAASGLYAVLGNPAALLPRPAVESAAHQVTADEVDQMVAGLAAKLEKNPGDMKGWAMLARSYHALGRSTEAAAAFARLGDNLDKDPTLLAEYADVLATQANGELEGKPLQLVMNALKLDPDHSMALSLAATAAYKRKDFPQAARHWRRLLQHMPADSEEAKWLTKTLAEIGQPFAAATDSALPAAATKNVAADDGVARGDTSVSGVVTLSAKLKADVRPDDTVFVFARAVDGSRLPLAVQRAKVAELPLRFKLDDSMAMSPQHKLSSATQVRIEAKVSRNGDAMPTAGELVATSEVVKPGARQVALNIDGVRP